MKATAVAPSNIAFIKFTLAKLGGTNRKASFEQFKLLKSLGKSAPK